MGTSYSKKTHSLLPTNAPPVTNDHNMTIFEQDVYDEVTKILKTDDNIKLLSFLENEDKQKKICDVLDPVRYNTALHIAVRNNAINCLKKLLEIVPKNLIDSPTLDGFTPLHIAAINANKIAIKILLDKKACPNVRNADGDSPLHLVLLKLGTENVSTEEVKKCMEVLINNLETDLDAVNAKKETPIELLNRIRTNVDITEFSTKLQTKNLNRSRSTSAKFYDCLARNEEDANVWNEILTNDKETVKALAGGFYGPNSILYHVVPNTVVTRFFLDKLNVNPAIKNLNGTIPLHKSLSYNDYETTDILIEKMVSNTWEKKCQDQKNRSFSLIKNAIDGAKKNGMKCLERLLDGNIILDINGVMEGTTTTALTYAAQMNNQDAMSILIAQGSYLGSSGEDDQRSVLNAIMCKTLTKAMDKCMSVNKTETGEEENSDSLCSQKYALDLKYKFLLPTYKEDEVACNEATTLYEISRIKDLRESLKHPLIRAFLYAKWLRIRPFFLVNLFLYLLFVLALTSFLYISKSVRMIENTFDNGNLTTLNDTQIQSLHDTLHCYKVVRDIVRTFVLLFTLYMSLKEIFQMFFTPKTYGKRVENFFEILLIVAVLVTSTWPWSLEATRHLGAWTMILAWYTFVLVLGRLPSLSIYIKQLRHVSMNFMKLIFLFGFLLLAFAISFNIIASTKHEFIADMKEFVTIIPRAIVMATGEFEYSSFNEQEEISSMGFLETLSTVFLFLLFIFLIFLVLMNLMTGLAVTDSKDLFDDATLYSLISRLELVYQNEQFFGSKWTGKFRVSFIRRFQVLNHESRTLTVWPNKQDKSKRILFRSGRRSDEEANENYCSLDNETSNLLRSHRLKIINEKSEN